VAGSAAYDFAGATVVVVGAGAGLGAAVVQAFLGAGARVVATSRGRADHLPAHERLRLAPLDAGEEATVAAFFAGLDALDALVNVVGGYDAGQPLTDLDLATLERQLSLNLRPAFLLTRHALRAMQAAGHGRIVHVASRAAVERGRNAFAYSASKQAVVRLVEAAAAENAHLGITVNCVLPSIIDTPANRAAMPDADFARWPTPEQVARVLLFLASDESALVSGAAVPVYGRA
jgi:NAD(P)-dependent dehydrogenase (short-subunit alcohol dehydrogenase family)